MNEQKINELYSSALLSMSNENEMVYNSFVAYQKMIADILELTPISVKCEGKTDLYVSFSLINTIIKNHLDILNKQNLEISKNIKEHKG
jgi:hypothetical protein